MRNITVAVHKKSAERVVEAKTEKVEDGDRLGSLVGNCAND